MKHAWATMVYHWRHMRWVLSYPGVHELHNKPWKLDKKSRDLIYSRWDAEWEAKEPKRPRKGKA